MTRSRLVSIAALMLSVLAIGLPAHATVMVEIPIEDLVRDADAIVYGTVERVGVRLVRAPGQAGLDPHTTTTIRVHEWIKGEGGTHVSLDELGGEMGEVGLRIDGTPRYRAGQLVVVFLHRVQGRYRTLQMAQGAFEVMPGLPGTPSIVQRDLGAIGLARWTEGRMTVEHGGRTAMRLDDFLAFVRASLEPLQTIPPAPRSDGPLGGGR